MPKSQNLLSPEHLTSLPQLAALARAQWQSVTMMASEKRPPIPLTLAGKLNFLRQQKVGRYSLIPAPDLWRGLIPDGDAMRGQRAMLHLDYTASSQALHWMESYLVQCMGTYANTHTETSTTGKVSTQRFHQAIEMIRAHVHAGAESFVIPAGYGATGAIERIQKILGVYLSPKGLSLIEQQVGIRLKEEMAKKVVVFVGPYEHHSNDVSWQENTLCSFVRIKALRTGPHANEIDCEDLEKQLKRFPDYLKIGSFSAASNVTGLKCDLKRIGEILHRHQCLFLVDFAASGPYADIHMERDGIDAVFLSLHKNLGGANVGFLIGRQHIYDRRTNPSFGGGGTVSAVTPWEYHFHAAIEERESAGTPAIRQTWQAALSMKIKEWVGIDQIQTIDEQLTTRMIGFFLQHPKLELLGNADPQKRYPIFSFLVRHGDRKLHHTYVAVLLNDLFGIQARSGCACAGPFGHELLGIERELSSQYVQLILGILGGFKPGWTRIGTHYTLSDAELLYTERALSAVAWFGPLFLDQYVFDAYTGDWVHQFPAEANWKLDFEAALAAGDADPLLPSLKDEASLEQCWTNQLEETYCLIATQIARQTLIEAAGKQSPEAQLDRLAAAIYPLVKDLIEGQHQDEQTFIHSLTAALCPLLAPPEKRWEDCQPAIEKLLRAIIFSPQLQPHRYEAFSGIDQHLPFFYVAAGRLSRPLRIKETLAASAEGQASCENCLSRNN